MLSDGLFPWLLAEPGRGPPGRMDRPLTSPRMWAQASSLAFVERGPGRCVEKKKDERWKVFFYFIILREGSFFTLPPFLMFDQCLFVFHVWRKELPEFSIRHFPMLGLLDLTDSSESQRETVALGGGLTDEPAPL